MHTKKIKVIFLLVIVGFLSTGILPATSQEDPIKIGVFVPDTDNVLSFYAPWTRQGFELGMIYATDNTNETEDGRPYEIIYYNTKGLTTEATTLATKAIETDGVDILVGGTYSSVAGALAPKAKETETLYFITPGAAASLTEDPAFNEYTFRVARNSWHDAKAGVNYAIDTVGATNFAFLAPSYSFGYAGVESMTQVIIDRGGHVVATEYTPLTTTDFTPQMVNLLDKDASIPNGIDFLFVIWAGDFSNLYKGLFDNDIASHMNVSGAVIDIATMNVIESTLTPPATLIGAQGLSLYGYQLPDNPVNDWMVQAHIDRNIMPNAALGQTYRVPELFTASAFATAQFLVNVTNEVKDLNVKEMICNLENKTIMTPKGLTRLRADDHQGLAEMYIAEVIKDDTAGSETNGQLIGKIIERLDAESVAPPIKTDYVPCALQEGAGGGIPGFVSPIAIFGLGAFAVIAIITSKRKK